MGLTVENLRANPPQERLTDILQAKMDKTRAIVIEAAMKVAHMEARLFDSLLAVDEPKKQDRPRMCLREELLSGMEEIQKMAEAISQIVERI